MKKALFTLLTILLPLLIIEAAVRLLLSGYIARQVHYAARLDHIIDQLFIRTTSDGREVYYSPHLPTRYYRDLPAAGGNRVDAIKGSQTYRILILGGSSVAGSPFGHWGSFARFLEDGLRSIVRPGAQVEVMNLGMSSASSTTVRLLLGHVSMLRPDLVAIYTGHNEICDAAAVDAIAAGDRRVGAPIDRIAHVAFDLSYTYRACAILASAIETVFVKQRTAFSVYPCSGRTTRISNAATLEAMTERYHSNIAAAVELAKGWGAQVLLIEQIANALDPPHDFASAPAQRLAAIAALATAFTSGAAAEFTAMRSRLAAIDPDSPFLPFYDGLIRLREDDAAGALPLLTQAIQRDRRPARFRPEYHEVLATIAAHDRAVHYLQLTNELTELVPDGIADGRLVIDTMHPTIELNKFIAAKIIEKYFLAHMVRPDVFDSRQYDRAVLYGPFPEEHFYSVVCRRYYGKADWVPCLEAAQAELDNARVTGRYDAYRRALRVWENAFYFGRTTGDRAALALALRLFQPITLVSHR